MKLLARASALLTTVLVAALLTLVPVAPAHAAINVFPLPTSNASPGRIVTAPTTGDMWFTEDDVNQIGRITPPGVITEYDLPPTTTGEGTVQDLDIGPDGTDLGRLRHRAGTRCASTPRPSAPSTTTSSGIRTAATCASVRAASRSSP